MASPQLHSHPDADIQPSRARYLIAFLIATGAISLYLTRHVLSVTQTEIQHDLGVGSAELGAVMSIFSLGYLLFQVPGGWFGNLVGTRWGLTTIGILWSLLTLATAFCHALMPLSIVRFLFGAVQAGYVPITAKIIKEWFPEKEIGMASAFVGISMSIGGALAMDVTGRLTGHFDWRVIFQIYAIVGLFWAIAYLVLFPRRKADRPGTDQVESKTTKDVPLQPKTGGHKLVTMVIWSSLIAICLQSFFRAAGYNFFVTFFPEYLMEHYGVSQGEAGIYSKWPLLGVVVGGLVGGILVDLIYRRTQNKWLSRSLISAVALFATAGFTFFAFYASSVTGFIWLIGIGAAFSGIGSPAAWAAMIDIGGRKIAVVAGFINMIGCFSGVLVTPILGGMMDILKDDLASKTVTFGIPTTAFSWDFELSGQLVTDWSQVVWMHAAFYLAGAVLWLMVRPSKPLYD
jgi:MFS family permease